jgi:hypothetical protein
MVSFSKCLSLVLAYSVDWLIDAYTFVFDCQPSVNIW